MNTLNIYRLFGGDCLEDKEEGYRQGHEKLVLDEKKNEIVKFSILDENRNFTILDEIWTKNG